MSQFQDEKKCLHSEENTLLEFPGPEVYLEDIERAGTSIMGRVAFLPALHLYGCKLEQARRFWIGTSWELMWVIPMVQGFHSLTVCTFSIFISINGTNGLWLIATY